MRIPVKRVRSVVAHVVGVVVVAVVVVVVVVFHLPLVLL